MSNCLKCSKYDPENGCAYWIIHPWCNKWKTNPVDTPKAHQTREEHASFEVSEEVVKVDDQQGGRAE